MRLRALSVFGGVSLTLLTFSACADAPTSLSTSRLTNDAQLLGGTVTTVGNLLVSPLHRSVPLTAPVSWSFTAGPNGATSSNSATGLTIAIPRGALSSTVTIRVTALEGTSVAYRFEPHGLQFAQNVQLTQSLRGLDLGAVNLLLLSGAHFPGSEPEYVGGLALVTEIVSARLNLLQNSMSFPIRHFSGWIAGSGRSSADDEGL